MPDHDYCRYCFMLLTREDSLARGYCEPCATMRCEKCQVEFKEHVEFAPTEWKCPYDATMFRSKTGGKTPRR